MANFLTKLFGDKSQRDLKTVKPYLTARPQASYLLTLTTADGRQHTLHLLSQADRFGSR